MARYYTSYTTRYDDELTGDSNISLIDDFFNDDTKFDLDGNTITIGNDSFSNASDRWDGMTDDAVPVPAEVVFWGKRIIVQDGASLTGTAIDGSHVWFVNCNIEIQGSAPGTGSSQHQAQRLGPDFRGDTISAKVGNPGRRDDTITGTKSGDTTWNYINCSFEMSGTPTTVDDVGVIVAGTMRDCTLTTTDPNGGVLRTYPMNGSEIENFTYDWSVSNKDGGHAYEFFSETAQADGINLINTYGYTGGAVNITYDQYSAVKVTDGQDDQPVVYRIFTEFNALDGDGTSSTNFVNPKTDLTPDGAIYWRWPNPQGVAIIRQRITRGFYDGPLHIATNGRHDVKMFFNTDYSAQLTGGALDTSKASSKTLYEYTTGDDGILEGRFNWNDGVFESSATDWGVVNDTTNKPIDLPIFSLKWDTTSTALSTGNYFNSLEELYDTEVTEMSLWGTHFDATKTRNKTNSYRDADEAAADNDLWVAIDESTQTDVDDPMMANYDDTDRTSIFAPLVADSGSVAFNDIVASIKENIWRQGEDALPFSNWTSTITSGNKYAGYDRGYNKLRIDPSQTSATGIDGTDTIVVSAPHDSNVAEIVNTDSDYIDTIEFDEIEAGTGYTYSISGGSIEVDTLSGLKSFDSIPSDTSSDFSLNNVVVEKASETGSTILNVNGNGKFYILNDLNTGTKIDVQNTDATGNVNVVLTGTNNGTVVSSDSTGGTVTLQKSVSVKLTRTDEVDGSVDDVVVGWVQGSTEAIAQADTAQREDADDVSISVDNSGDNAVYTIQFAVPPADNIWATIDVEQHEQEVFQDIDGTHERVLTPIPEDNVDQGLVDSNVFNDNITITPTEIIITQLTSANDDVVILLNQAAGNSVTTIQMPDQKTRTFIRNFVMRNTEWLRATALGYIPTDRIEFLRNNIQVLSDANQSVQFNRPADVNNTWKFGTTVLSEGGADLYDTLTAPGQTGQQIGFSPLTTPSLGRIEEIVNAARDNIKGVTSDDNGKNLTDISTEVGNAAIIGQG